MCTCRRPAGPSQGWHARMHASDTNMQARLFSSANIKAYRQPAEMERCVVRVLQAPEAQHFALALGVDGQAEHLWVRLCGLDRLF